MVAPKLRPFQRGRSLVADYDQITSVMWYMECAKCLKYLERPAASAVHEMPKTDSKSAA